MYEKEIRLLEASLEEINPVGLGGRRTLWKGGSSSSSSSSNTVATDNRVANDSGLVATNGSSLSYDASLKLTNTSSDSSIRDSGNTTTMTDNSVTQITDGGAVKSAMDAATTGYANLMKTTEFSVDKLTDAISDVGRQGQQNYGALLATTDGQVSRAYGGLNSLVGVADKLFTRAADTATAQAQGFTQAVTQAYDNAKASQTGALDNKTIMILGLAGAAAVVAIYARKGR